jgi:hypothetical protein
LKRPGKVQTELAILAKYIETVYSFNNFRSFMSNSDFEKLEATGLQDPMDEYVAGINGLLSGFEDPSVDFNVHQQAPSEVPREDLEELVTALRINGWDATVSPMTNDENSPLGVRITGALSPEECFDAEMAAIIRNLAKNSNDPELEKIAYDVTGQSEAGMEVLDYFRAYDEETFGPLK